MKRGPREGGPLKRAPGLDDGVLRGAVGDVLRGPFSNDIFRGPQEPTATVLDGVSGHITIDDLAPLAYTEVGDVHQIMLVKGPDTTSFLSVIGNNDATLKPLHSLLRSSTTAGSEGFQQPLIQNQTVTVVNDIMSAATQHKDDRWHMIHGADWDVAGTGTLYVQTDGAPRELVPSTYARFAVDATYPAWFTLGAIRRDATPDISSLADATLGYFALITGAQLSQAQMDIIWDAFDTGGGRENLRIVTAAIETVVAAAGGTVQWAGELDGNRTPPHVNNAGAAAPIYVDCTFEDADYDLLRWAYFGAGVAAQCSAANAQEVEDVYDDVNGDISFLCAMEAAPVLGGPDTNRVINGAAGDDDTNGSFTNHGRKNPTGELLHVYRTDIGAEILGGVATSQVVFGGAQHLIQEFDTATTGTGTLKAQIDSDAIETLDASYVRASLGVLDLYSPAGRITGPVPAFTSPLGWVYWRIVVAADLESIADDIATAYAAAVGQLAKYLAVRAVIIAGGFGASIIYSQAFYQGSTADDGDDATLTGVVYTAEGVSP